MTQPRLGPLASGDACPGADTLTMPFGVLADHCARAAALLA